MVRPLIVREQEPLIAKKENTCPMTVYFPESIMRKITQRTKITGRSKNKEVLYLIDLGFSIGKEGELRALSQMIQHLPK